MKSLLWGFISLIWLSFFSHTGHSFFMAPRLIDIQPKSVKRCTTETQIMNCTVLDESYNATGLVFKLNDDLVKPGDVKIVDNRTASIQIENITEDMQNLNVLCCANNCAIWDSINMQVYVKPVPVSDLSCVIYDFSLNVTCTWDYGVDYAVIQDTEWPNVTCYVGLLQTPIIAEWKIQNLETKKVFTNPKEVGIFSQVDANFTIGMSVTSRCGVTVNKTFDGESVVKVEPKPVIEFGGVAVNSTCIQLEWTHNRPTYTKTYFIAASSQWGDRQMYVNESQSNRNIKGYVMCDLVPGTDYTFTIKVKPLLLSGIWSLPKGTNSKTHDDVPGSSPTITEGSYSWNRDECQDGTPLRLIYIYFMSIPDQDHHGILSGIRYNLTSSDGSESDLLTDVTATIISIQLSCDSSYTLTLQAENSMGLSKEPSTLAILRADKDVSRDLLVEKTNHDGSVYLEWGNTSHTEPTDAASTVFYIEATNCARIARGHANWKTYSPGTTSGNMTLLPGKEPENFCFGRAVETPLGSSGFEWSSCIYMKDSTPTQSPSDLTVVEGTEDNSLVLTWSKWLCPVGEPFVSQYEVIYCPSRLNSNCSVSGDNDSKRYSREATSATLSDLNSEVKYEIRIRAVTRLGAVGPWSEPILGQSVDRSLKPGTIAWIAAGGVFGFILVIAFIILICRKAHKSFKVRLDKSRAIDDPDIKPDPTGFDGLHGTYVKSDDFSNNNSYSPSSKLKLDLTQRQDSDDSGVPEDPLTPPPNSKEQLRKITQEFTEGYVKADHGYIIPQDVTMVGFVHLDMDVPVDSYVHAHNTVKDEIPLPNALRNSFDGYVYGSDNRAFTDEYGNKSGKLSPKIITEEVLCQTTATVPENNTELSVVEVHVQPDHIADINHDFTYQPDDLEEANKKREQQKLLLNCLTGIPSPKLDFDQDGEQDEANPEDFQAVSHSSVHSQSGHETNTSVSPPSVLNKPETRPMVSGYVFPSSVNSQADTQTNNSDYISPHPELSQSNTQPMVSDYVSPQSVLSQSNTKINVSDYVYLPSVPRQSNTKNNESDYVSLPSVCSQVDTQLNNSNYVSPPSVQSQSDTKPNTNGYVSQQSIHSQSNTHPNVSDYVSPPSVHSHADIQYKISDNVSPPSVHSQTDTQPKVSDYVSPPSVHSQTDTQPKVSDYVSPPSVHSQSDTQPKVSDYVSPPSVHSQADTQSKVSDYVSLPSVQSQSDISGYISHPAKLNQSEANIMISGYVQHPGTHTTHLDTQMSGDVPYVQLHNQPEHPTTGTGTLAKISENVPQGTPQNQNQSEYPTNETGYIPHSSILNQADYVPHSFVSDPPDSSNTGYVPLSAIQGISPGVITPLSESSTAHPIKSHTNIAISPSDNITISPSENITISPLENITISPSENITISPSENIPISPSDNIAISPSENITISPSDYIAISPSEISPNHSHILHDSNTNSYKPSLDFSSPYVTVDEIIQSRPALDSSTDDKEDSGVSSLESSGDGGFEAGHKGVVHL